MGDIYLKDFAEDSPGLSDFLILSGGNGNDQDFKAMASAVAALLVETYAGSTLAGSAQTIQAALNRISITDPGSDGNLVLNLRG